MAEQDRMTSLVDVDQPPIASEGDPSESVVSSAWENSSISNSSVNGSSSHGSTTHHARRPGLADKESRQVFRSKLLVIMMLMAASTIMAVAAFFFAKREEESDFESKFQDVATEILKASKKKVEDDLRSLERLSLLLTGFAIGTEAEWPFVTLEDFDTVGEHVRGRLKADWTSFLPLVTEAERNAYEIYTKEHLNLLGDNDVDPFSSPTIFPLEDPPTSSSIPLEQRYAPLRHITNASNHLSLLNFDALSLPEFSEVYETIVSSSSARAIFSKINNLNESQAVDDATLDDSAGWPRSFLAQPVFNQVEDDREVVGIINSYVPLHWFFQQVSHDLEEIFVVIQNSCDQVVTYRVKGDYVMYEGVGDLHDGTYNHLRVTSNDTVFDTIENCLFSIHVYPSNEFHDSFASADATIFLVGVVCIFLITAIVFFVYDITVEKRQRLVLAQALRTGALIDSFFPQQVRDRLMEGEHDSIPRNKGNKNEHGAASANPMATFSGGRKSIENIFGKEIPMPNNSSKPIADLYPNTSVLFADIAGFTAWASVREPSQVFTLLEQIYNGFDKIAKSRKVFKIETIGDCYVAVTGLPNPRPDHAQAMARFARDCMNKMKEMVGELGVILGPGTDELGVRMGIHSGPVTAGVLRGAKSRFQLFGDTVNTAARMESTGVKNKIQISQETADLLIAADKSQWLKPRSEKVTAKGKGEMQTYWLTFRSQSQSSLEDTSSDNASDDMRIGFEQSEAFSAPSNNGHIDRLIRWNVDVLLRHLQKIVAMRETKTVDSDNGGYKSTDLTLTPRGGATVLEEVRETINLQNQASKYKRNPANITLDPKVESQLYLFVKSVAEMYRENHFHNFEHASHVTQSLTKLLSRVITPDAIDFDDLTYKKKTATARLHKFTFGITSDPLIQFACAFSALIHDADHPGVPNSVLVKEKQEIAELYKHQSVAEQNSVELAWGCLMEPTFKELREVIYTTQDELERFRQLVVNSVMATDIVDKQLGALRKKRWDKAFKLSGEEPSVPESPDESVNRKATIVIEHLIQAADVAHMMQHWHVYIKWNERFFRECYQVYLDGRSDADPSVGWYKGELGFFDFYIIPLAKKLESCGVFGVSSDECLGYAEANRDEWEKKGEELVQRYMEYFRKA